MAVVEVERCGGYAVVTMNRPEAMNALSKALRTELAHTIDALEADADIRAIILTGAGDRAFTAGSTSRSWDRARRASPTLWKRTIRQARFAASRGR